jgi:hypothetical protein
MVAIITQNVELGSEFASKYRQYCHQNESMDSQENFWDEIKMCLENTP